jgi:hypothetical protein
MMDSKAGKRSDLVISTGSEARHKFHSLRRLFVSVFSLQNNLHKSTCLPCRHVGRCMLYTLSL